MRNHQSIAGFSHGKVETVERIEGLPRLQAGTQPSMALESLRKVLRSLGLGKGRRESTPLRCLPRQIQTEGPRDPRWTVEPVATVSKCDRAEERL